MTASASVRMQKPCAAPALAAYSDSMNLGLPAYRMVLTRNGHVWEEGPMDIRRAEIAMDVAESLGERFECWALYKNGAELLMRGVPMRVDDDYREWVRTAVARLDVGRLMRREA